MNYDNTAFYSTASSGYIQYSVTSLLTIRDHIPDASLVIFGTFASDYERSIMDENNIEFIEIDLTDRFTRVWDYPVETYYIFAGPERLYEDGYEYSVYIDGDILCKGDPLRGLPAIKCIAGVPSLKTDGSSIGIFGDDWPELSRIYNIPKSIESRDRINAGVVYFNNKNMKKIGLLDMATEMFNKCLDNNVPRKGDDSLFSLLQMVHLKSSDLLYLSSEYNYVLQFNPEWKAPIEDLRFFHFSIDKPWKDNPYKHNNLLLDIFNPYVKEWRSKFLSVTGDRQLLDLRLENANLKNNISSIVDSRSWRIVMFFQKFSPSSLWHKLRIARLEALKLPINKRIENGSINIKTWYWIAWDYYGPGKNMFNFGDVCTVDIVREIFGYNIVWSPIDKCEFIGTGSIIQVAQNESAGNRIKVWGSGFIKKPDTKLELNNLTFFAIRGRLSASEVDERVPMGDPGILASVVYKGATRRSNKIGVVLHYKDMESDLAKRLASDDRFKLISPLESPDKVAFEISECKLVLSSSLHGLIFADSFKVPNAWIKPSDKLDGGDYKFKDYCSGVKKELIKADIDNIFLDSYLNSLILKYKPLSVRRIQKRLIRAFPYK